ncbi:hypothetical protein A5792_08295 [Mycolicibacterium peregrinum]|uniref:DUF732 domain-containing protein n=1 Tax=Mycolicibacterium peregrinum TaxID=43304 RepID=A0A1A0QIE4_MYCPR|nr:DUF732 domain-containing protein [Mycolicibacterium peregrinum]OBB22010.1 hypothetical protein A5792_08295 [Mycolicibacterium peregrinum]
MNKHIPRRIVTAAVITGAPAMMLAVLARADQYDFVAQIDSRGVYYASISDVIDDGKMACRMLRGGASVPAALNYVAGDGFAEYEAVVIVVAAAQNMCPDVMPTLAAYANADSGPVARA